MSKARRDVSRELARELIASENQIDLAFATLAGFAARLPQLRVQANVSAVVGNAAFAHVSQAVALQAQVRTLLVAAHEELSNIADRVGIKPGRDTYGYGDTGDKFIENESTSATPPLRVAA